MSNMGSKRAKLALMLVLGVALWGGGVELPAALGFSGTAEEFIATYGSDSLRIKYTNYETEVTATGQQLNGILEVNTIQALNAGGATIASWAPLDSGGETGNGQLNGIFNDLIVQSTSPSPVVSGQPATFTFSGGEMALFGVGDGTFNPAASSSTDLAGSIQDVCGGATCPAPLLTLNFASGISSNSSVTLIANLKDSLPPTGSGSGYLDTGSNGFGTGSENNLIHHQAINTAFGPRDLFLNSSLSAPCGTPGVANCGNWPVFSSDPVTNPVPEPASVVLVGAGLGALGLWRRIHRSAQYS